jgi:hypothetical protein
VGIDTLRVFIRGCEIELKNERASVKRLIERLGLETVSSEGRPASSRPIRKKYPPEVIRSDVYVGIFGTKESDDSINEYHIARNSGIDRLIFVKRAKRYSRKIQNFLKEIMDPDEGIYYRKFYDVTDLDTEVQKALVSTMSDRFRESFKESRKGGEQNIGEKKQVESPIESDQFILATGNILEFELIPSSLVRGKDQQVKAKVFGKGKYIFLTLMLVKTDDLDNTQSWWANNDTVDLSLNGGKLELKNQEYETCWTFPVYPDLKTGKYIAFLGMYQDTYDLPTLNRRLVDFKIKIINLV